MDEVRGYCRSNLDSARHETWPRSFGRVPVVGELVQSAGGRRLRVVQVTHAENEYGPTVEIELHLLAGDTLAADIERSR